MGSVGCVKWGLGGTFHRQTDRHTDMVKTIPLNRLRGRGNDYMYVYPPKPHHHIHVKKCDITIYG